MEQLDKVENSSVQVNEMVNAILGDTLVEVDAYVAKVRSTFLDNQEILDDDLDKIILQLPVYLYNLIVLAQQIEMKKGLAAEHSKYTKNEAMLNATGTIADKTAKAENATAPDRITELAYKTAASIVSKTIDSASVILDSAKKVQQKRIKEKLLTAQGGSGVGAF